MDTTIDTDIPNITLQTQDFDLELLCDNLTGTGYFYCHNFLPHHIIDGLYDTIRGHEQNNTLSVASVGRGTDKHHIPQIRTDKTLWINGDTPCEQEFLNFIEKIRLYLNQTLFLGLPLVETHYALYHAGDYYKRHLDSFAQSKTQTTKSRIISMVIYLNKNWQLSDGGLLELYANPNATEPCGHIIPEYNHAVFFLSEAIPHQVTLCHKTRYSIACWFRYE